jgi:hypothetical protein
MTFIGFHSLLAVKRKFMQIQATENLNNQDKIKTGGIVPPE